MGGWERERVPGGNWESSRTTKQEFSTAAIDWTAMEKRNVWCQTRTSPRGGLRCGGGGLVGGRLLFKNPGVGADPAGTHPRSVGGTPGGGGVRPDQPTQPYKEAWSGGPMERGARAKDGDLGRWGGAGREPMGAMVACWASTGATSTEQFTTDTWKSDGPAGPLLGRGGKNL